MDSESTSSQDVATAARHGRRRVTPAVLDLTVLMGGPSSEREVSLVSGAAVADALERNGHKVHRSDIGPDNISALLREGIDAVFIVLHGAFGESGEVQELCEQQGLRYTGSPPRASRLAMDKHATKQAFRRLGLATPDWTVLSRNDSSARQASELARLTLPVVVKPVDGGSSVDVTIARDAATRDAAVSAAIAKYGRVMVEAFIAGREMTVGILGDQALPPIQVVPAREFYDYTAKYADGAGTRYLVNPELTDDGLHVIQESALKAHRGMGCRHMSRVDFIVDADGRAWALEVNTIPGFTSHSLLPMAAREAGIPFDELVERIVRMAMAD